MFINQIQQNLFFILFPIRVLSTTIFGPKFNIQFARVPTKTFNFITATYPKLVHFMLFSLKIIFFLPDINSPLRIILFSTFVELDNNKMLNLTQHENV